MGVSSLLSQLSAPGTDWFPVLADAVVKGVAVLSLAGLATLVMRRSSAAARHLVWFLGALSLLILPVLSATLPGWYILPRLLPDTTAPVQPAVVPATLGPAPAPPAVDIPEWETRLLAQESPAELPVAPLAPSPLPPAPAPSPLSLPWRAWVTLAWLLGSVLFLGRVMLGYVSLWRLRRRSSRVAEDLWPVLLRKVSAQLGLRRPVELLVSPQRAMPMTWGLWRTRLLLPEETTHWPSDQCRAVLLHELAHAKRWDCLTQLVAQIACALHWFNPLVWVAWRRMQTERERACDDLVLSTGAKASTYAEQLLHIASDMPTARFSAAAIAMARPSKLEGRLLAILDATRSRKAVTRLGLLLGAIALLGVALPLAMLRAESREARQPEESVVSREEDVRPEHPAASQPSNLSAELDREVSVRVYDVRDIVVNDLKRRGSEPRPAGNNATRADGLRTAEEQDRTQRTQDLCRLIKESIAPGTWEPEGTVGSLDVWNERIIVRHTAAVNRELADVFRRIRGLDDNTGSLEAKFRLSVKYLRELQDKNAQVTSDGKGRSVAGRMRYFVRLVAAEKTLTFEGQQATWEQLPALIAKVPDRAHTVFEFGHAPENSKFPVWKLPAVLRSMTSVRERAERLAEENGFEMFNEVSGDPLGSVGTPSQFVPDLAALSAADSGPWGEAVEQVQCSLRVDRKVWGAEETPWVRACIRHNRTTDVVIIPGENVDGLIVDGVWYHCWWGKGGSYEYVKRGTQSSQFLYLLGQYWRRVLVENGKTPSFCKGGFGMREHLLLAPGRHEVRVVVEVSDREDFKRGRTIQVISNPVEIEVLPPTATRAAVPQPASSPGATRPVDAKATPASAPSVAAGELAGTVTDDAGKPLAKALVDVWTWYPGKEAMTDQQGRFVLKNLGSDPVEIRVSKEGYGPWYDPNQVTGVSDMQISLSNKTYFEGDVKGPDGKTVSGALIRADCGPKRNPGVVITTVWTETRSDANGHYRLYVMPDQYDIQVRVPNVGAARFAKVWIDEDEKQTLDIKLERGVTFQATVVDSQSGDPVPNVRLWHFEHKGIEGTSDKNGKIVITGMPPGKFTFDVQAKGYKRWWSAQAAHPSQQKNLRESFQRNFDYLDFELAEDMEPVTIEVEREVRITGVVQDPDGKPVAGATVAPARTGSGNSLTGDTRFSVVSGKDGTFVMTLPASGSAKYNLMVHDGKYQEWRKWANGVLDPIQTKPGDELKDIVIKLTRPAVVRGQVKDVSGGPAADREVRASAADKLENRYYDPTTRTDKNGNFELRFVRAGRQYIQVAPFWQRGSVEVTLKEGELKQGVVLEEEASDRSPIPPMRGARPLAPGRGRR